MSSGINGSGATNVALGTANPVAFWLSLAGVVIQGLAAIMIVTMFTVFSGFVGMMRPFNMMGGYYGGSWQWMAGAWLFVGAITLALGVLGLLWMNSSRVGNVKNGSILVLVGAIIAFPMAWGFGIGSILMLVGAILGLTTTQTRA
ncbi:MAG TPA: hypothetical protein VGR53_02650 [Nitrososphaerales archaeon]|nr:hypothetical protein [Nitrososphaerales archaeon]